MMIFRKIYYMTIVRLNAPLPFWGGAFTFTIDNNFFLNYFLQLSLDKNIFMEYSNFVVSTCTLKL